MAITIKGIRIKSLTVSRNEDGGEDVSAHYELISSNDKVLAKKHVKNNVQPYEADEGFKPSNPCMKGLSDAIAAYKKELEQSIGLEE